MQADDSRNAFGMHRTVRVIIPAMAPKGSKAVEWGSKVSHPRDLRHWVFHGKEVTRSIMMKDRVVSFLLTNPQEIHLSSLEHIEPSEAKVPRHTAPHHATP
jgi:hypothetical protein